ncbi:MAG: SDR family NAD(P)-dependent oxidoreductase [Xanthomonadales bacterium]|nr:SDR family NAD(P)-dependent oxidoreductase [Xanthomonadales bacterium]
MTNTRTAIITGTTSGIGTALCQLLLRNKYNIICINRNEQTADEIRSGLLEQFPEAKITNFTADLSDLVQIEAVAAKISKQCKTIDLLFNNAGVLIPTKMMSAQGVEMHFAVNTIAPYFLTKLLLPQMSAAEKSAVIISGSGARKMVDSLEVGQLSNPKDFKVMSGAYAQSKAAVSLIFSCLQQQKHEGDILFSTIDLPATKTRMAKSPAMPTVFKLFSFMFSSPQKSAQKLYAAAISRSQVAAFEAPRQTRKKLLELVEHIVN